MKRAAVGLGVALVVGLLGWWLLPSTPGASGEAAVAPGPVPLAVPAPAPQPVEQPMLAAPEAEPPPVDDAPEIRALEAVAEAAGDGVVRCRLPPGAPSGVPRGFARAEREGMWVVATVSSAEGQALLLRPEVALPADATDAEAMAWAEVLGAPPFALAVWWDAFPGETGSCDVQAVETVEVRGRVAFLDGPVSGQVHGCGGSHTVADDGTFAFETERGPPCGLSFREKGMGRQTMVDLASPTGVVVPEHPSRSMAERLEEMRDEEAYLLDTPDPVALALEQGDHPAEVEAVLGEWAAADAAEREVKVESLQRMVEFFEEQEALGGD